jgi:exodeoxyribonuclease X
MSALVIDTETTGFDEPQPVEVAWLRLDDPLSLKVTEMFCVRYRPSKPISLGALATHHIMDEDLANCEPYTAFRLPDGVEYLIGHNADFDWEAIGKPDVKRIDTCALSRKLWPQADTHSLGAMLYLLEREAARDGLRGAHSALRDAENCVVLLHHILRALGHPMTWNAVWLLSEDARVPTHMNFGKHKGTLIADVPADYKRWLLAQPDVDQYLRKALTS